MVRDQGAYDAGQRLLTYIGYGDACGLPFETWTQTEVLRTRPGGIRRLFPTIDNPYFGSANAGVWSDDTSLSLAVAEALIVAGDFSMEAMAQSHGEAMAETDPIERDGRLVPRGVGDSTWQSLERIRTGQATWHDSGNPHATGNGVLIKLAPLALWQALRETPEQEAHEQIRQLTIMTHASHLAIVASLTHGHVLRRVFADPSLPPGNIPAIAADQASRYERKYSEAGNTTSRLLGKLALRLETAKLQAEDISIDAQWALAVIENSGLHPSSRPIGLHCSEALAMTYGTFVSKPRFPHNVYEAIALGGDTDSIASMVSAMSALRVEGEEPADLNQLYQLDRLRQTGIDLVNVALTA